MSHISAQRLVMPELSTTMHSAVTTATGAAYTLPVTNIATPS